MAMSFVWLLLTATVTCMCASPRCKSNAASLSVNDYCAKLCAWGRGGNLCHCNAFHFVGKRRDLGHQELGHQELSQDNRHGQRVGQNFGSEDEKRIWGNTDDNDDDNDDDDDDDDDTLTAPDDWLGNENSTSTDTVWPEQSRDDASSMWSHTGSRRRRPPLIFMALRRLGRHQEGAEDTEQLLRDIAKKGKQQEQLVVDESSEEAVMTLNALTRRPKTFMVSPKMKPSDTFRKITSKSRKFRQPIAVFLPARRSKPVSTVLATATWLAGWVDGCHAPILCLNG